MKLKIAALTALTVFLFSFSVSAQNLKYERERHQSMLKLIVSDVRKNYFDPKFKGIDLDAKAKIVHAKLEEAVSIGQMSGIIAQFLIDFDDSHLYFLPPRKANKTDYGFEMTIVGDRCFVTGVDKKSDAETKGLQIGDEVIAMQGYRPIREDIWKLRYLFFTLRPQPTVRLDIMKPSGKQVNYEILPKIIPGKRVMDLTGSDINTFIRETEDAYRKERKQYFYDKFPGVFIWKMPSFNIAPNNVDDIMDRVRKNGSFILDLRGNGGGRVDMVLRLIGNVIPENIKVGDEVKRKGTKEVIAKTRGSDVFTGKIIVLVDAGSGSASEVFSKVIQHEKRGIIIGDRSAGAVMEAQYFANDLGLDTKIFFGASITIADLIMKDGKSLEKVGVFPDIALLPTGSDLFLKRDVVMAKALETLGLKTTPEEAFKIFPEETAQ